MVIVSRVCLRSEKSRWGSQSSHHRDGPHGLWYVSCGYGMAHMKEKSSDFWFAVLVLSLPVALLFTAILWWSYFRSDRTHSGWVTTATLVLLSPVLLSLLIYAFY